MSTRRSKILAFAVGILAVAPAFAGLRFTPVPGPPDALVISSMALAYRTSLGGAFIAYGLFAVPGRGMFELNSTQYVPDPCADAQIVDVSGSPYRAWTMCGLVNVSFVGPGYVVTPAGAGLPTDAQVTAMLNGLVGTSNSGVYAFGSSTTDLTASSDGLPANAPVQSLGLATSRTYVALSGGGLYVRAGSLWEDVSGGLPAGSTVTAVGGDPSAFAAVDAHGVWRRMGTGIWRLDANGAGSAPVSAFAGSFAAARTTGLLRHVDGGWLPETSGLPPGTDARVIASVPGGSPYSGFSKTLYLGTGGQGVFSASATPSKRLLPAIVDTVGATGQRFQTALVIGNIDSHPIVGSPLTVFLPSPGASTGLDIPAGREQRAADAFSWLQARGLDVSGVTVTSLAGSGGPFALPRFYMLARVYTTDSAGGTYGVTLDAPSDIDAAEEEASVYGLRSTAGIDRANLAVVPMPGRSTDPVTLSVQVFSEDGTPAPTVLTRMLAPGEFFQWNDVLLLAGLPQGSSGYARISRTAGIGAWTGYGVVNDAATSDGAVLPLYRPGGLAAARRLLVPVVLDAYGTAGSHYTTELTLANDSPKPSTVSLLYHAASGYGAPLTAPRVTVSIGPGGQVTLPDVLAYLRSKGVAVPDPLAAGPQAGTLEVVFDGLDGDDAARTIALARTTTPNPNSQTGGRFGVAYPAVAWGGGAQTSALVPALTEDASTRSNLAVANAGGGSEGPITLSVQLRDADSGANTGVPLVVTLSPGDWFQWNRVISLASATTTRAIATVTLVSGDDTFFAYGVLNDAKTSDGSFIRMIPLDGE